MHCSTLPAAPARIRGYLLLSGPNPLPCCGCLIVCGALGCEAKGRTFILFIKRTVLLVPYFLTH